MNMENNEEEEEEESYQQDIELLISDQYGLSELYAILAQLVIGLLLNSVILCSIAHNWIQIKRNSGSIGTTTANQSCASYSSDKHRKTPVIDIIVATLSGTALLRLLARSALQLFCLYGTCWTTSETLCYFHGFVNSFLHYLFLWTMMLFAQNRYMAHYKQYDYICKCSHFVLYITLIGAAFLTSLHISGPIYGFSSYRFVIEELTCTVDWLSRYSCPYLIFSTLLVYGPAYVPLLYWTSKITFKHFASCSLFSCTCVFKQTKPQTNIKHDRSQTQPKSSSTLFPNYYRSFKRLHLMNCCANQLSTNQTCSTSKTTNFEMQNISTNDSNNNDLSKQKSFRTKTLEPKLKLKKNSSKQRSTKSCNNVRVTFETRCSTSSELMFSSDVERSKVNSYRSKSHLLIESNEILTVVICCWIFILSYTPKMLDNACKACLEPVRSEINVQAVINETEHQNQTFEWNQQSVALQPLVNTMSNTTNSQYNFYLTYWDETVACVLIPLTLVLLHSKLCSILVILSICVRLKKKHSSINL